MTQNDRLSTGAWAQLAGEIRRAADRRALLEQKPQNDRKSAADRLHQRQLYRARIRQLSAPEPQPIVSVVLGTYNRCGLLKTAIRSIRENNIDVPFEIVVVDGGSTDGTIGWLVKQQDIVAIIHHNRRDGRRLRSWGWFMNLALRAAHGKFVAIISDDCYVHPGAVQNGLDAAISATRQNRRIAGVAFAFRGFPAEEKFYLQYTFGGMLMVNHGIFLRSALEKVGFVEEELFDFYKADSDLSLKLWATGYEIITSPNSFVDNFVDPDEATRIENAWEMDADRRMFVDLWSPTFCSRLPSEEFQLPFRKEAEANPARMARPPWSKSSARRVKQSKGPNQPGD